MEDAWVKGMHNEKPEIRVGDASVRWKKERDRAYSMFQSGTPENLLCDVLSIPDSFYGNWKKAFRSIPRKTLYRDLLKLFLVSVYN